MNQRANKKRKYNYGRILDLFLFLVFPLVAILFIFTIKKFTTKYTIVLSIAFAIIYAIAILTCLIKKRKVRKVIDYSRRIIIIALCLVIGWAYNQTSSISRSFSNITDNDEHKTTTYKLDVLSLKDNDFNSVKDLDNLVIGVQTSNEKDNSKYVLKKLDQAGITYETKEYDDFTSMYADYYNGYVNGIVINNSQKQSLPEEYADLYQDSDVLKTYKRVVENNYKGNDIDVTSEVFTVYLSASDQTGAPASNSLSDMNMLMIIDPNYNTIKTISIPRDSYVPNPALDDMNDKLTHTGNDGIENTVKAVENMFDIEIDFYAKISFDSLIKIVDTLDGIDVDVLISFCEQDENRSFAAEDEICLNKGKQKLNGKQALAYSRHRHSYENQDIGRNDAQLRVIKGIIKKLMTTDGINKIDDILDILPTYVITNFSDSQLSSFIRKQVDELKEWNISSIELNKGTTDMDITASGGNELLSVYYFSEKEIDEVNAVYNIIKEKPSMAKFKYDPTNPFATYSTHKENSQTVTTE